MTLMDSLRKLHQVDSQVRGLRSRLDSATRNHDAQKKLLDEIAARLAELKTRKRHIQAKIANLETEGAAFDEQLEKFRGDLNSAATNKQYTAVLTEMNTVKESRSGIDDVILGDMAEVDAVEAEIVEVEEQHAAREKVLKVAVANLAERNKEVGARLAELEQERDAAASDVPGTALAVFEELARAYDGEAMAQVEEIDRRRREYACSECNMQMPFEQVSTLMTHTDNLVRCTACFRILLLPEETRCALAPK